MDEKKENKQRFVPVARHKDYTLSLDIVGNRDEAAAFFADLLKGRTDGVTSVAEAMLVYGRCRELRLPFMSTLDHMCVIGKKVCADIHIKTALALRAGSLSWERIKDFEPQYQYTDGESVWISHLTPVKFLRHLKEVEEDPLADSLFYVWNEASTADCASKNKRPFWNALNAHNAVYDYVTEYRMIRKRKLVDGSYQSLEGIGRFGRIASHVARLGYAKDGSGRDSLSNWGKYERRMIDVRAWDNAFKEVASDIAMGMPEISEMAEAYDIPYNFDPETGNAQIVKDPDNPELFEQADEV
jgi:hypothetical protein